MRAARRCRAGLGGSPLVRHWSSSGLSSFDYGMMRDAGTDATAQVRSQVQRFDPVVPLCESLTAPASWYTRPAFLSLERWAVFQDAWLHVGHVQELGEVGSFVTRSLLGENLLLVRDNKGELRCFHNACRHHAMPLATGSGMACKGPLGGEFVCPYHGWTYLADGRLRKATKMKGIKNFKNKDNGLHPVHVGVVEGLVFVNLSPTTPAMSLDEYAAGPLQQLTESAGDIASLKHVARREYDMDCNWKVFVDNYADGGYHVPYAHPGLSDGIDMGSYSIDVSGMSSAQLVTGSGTDRLGKGACYTYLYPNLMLNRYGPWLDTNTVIPLGPDKCRVVFDWFVQPELASDEEYVQQSLEASDLVQQEDHDLCHGVQVGLTSSGYDQGRYNPEFESPMYHFHSLLHQDYTRALDTWEAERRDAAAVAGLGLTAEAASAGELRVQLGCVSGGAY